MFVTMAKLNEYSIKKLLEQNCFVNGDSKLLLTVSGGMDSMVMLDMILKAGLTCEVAHCNFNLRGKESDKDERLVRDVCKEAGVKLHVRSFDTKKYAAEKGISIEMAARDLRYEWFYSLLKEHSLDVIVTAHHGDDTVETFFLNLVRGTGIKGLSGMKYVNGKVVRPMLDLSRANIEEYAKENDINYRHDSSNDEVKYLRNKVRHEIIPLFKEMNPSFFNTMTDNLKRLTEVEELLEDEVRRFLETSVVKEGGRTLIPISSISVHPQRDVILFEILQPYGFNSDVIDDIERSIDGIAGKQFYSQSYRLIRDRFNFILFERSEISNSETFINSEVDSIEEPVKLEFATFVKSDDYSFSKDSAVAHFDAGNVEFPLKLRRWQQGDLFRPLGMKGFKKLSDFFIDQKFSIADKEDVWVLQSGDDILWIVGMRMDDRFKITNRTKKVFEVKFVKNV